jgi:hypothetical protein
MAGVFGSWLLTHYRREMNHRFRRSSLTKPLQKFTCVHPSDLPFARRTWMVQALLGLHPSAVARFIAWRLQGLGTWLDTSQEHDNESCSLKLARLRVASPPPNRTGTFQRIRLSSASFITMVRHGDLRGCPDDIPRRPPVFFASAPT